jgi:hypothetical protein
MLSVADDYYVACVTVIIMEVLEDLQSVIYLFQPLRIGGVKVYDRNVSRNEIIMDMDIL